MGYSSNDADCNKHSTVIPIYAFTGRRLARNNDCDNDLQHVVSM